MFAFAFALLLEVRRFEVGADATDARADNPGRDCGIELHPGKPPLPSPPLDFTPLPKSGSEPEYSVDAATVEEMPVAGLVIVWRDTDCGSTGETVLL